MLLQQKYSFVKENYCVKYTKALVFGEKEARKRRIDSVGEKGKNCVCVCACVYMFQ